MPANPRCSRRRALSGLCLGPAGLILSGEARADGLRRTSPEQAGIDPAGILAFLDGVEQKMGGLHGFMLLRGGKVAAEGYWAPYSAARPHMLYSLSKSFTSTAVGLAVAEGRLEVEAPVVSFFPDSLPARVDRNLAKMQVRHLLTMNTGHDRDATGPMRQAPGGDWVKAFLALPVEHAPGSKFVYNSAATYMCSAIVQKLTGQTVLRYLQPRLFQPLGIARPTWESCPKGISTGGWGLSVRVEDIARFGQLYLQRGQWGDRQLLSEHWVHEATSRQVLNGSNRNSDWNQGYGYQFWRCRHGAYRGDGAFGQYCVVMPEQDAVLAITSGIRDMQAVLNVVWETLLPAMSRPALVNGPDRLRPRLATLAVAPPDGRSGSPLAAGLSGRTFAFERNDEKLENVRLEFHDRGCRLAATRNGRKDSLDVGNDRWREGRAPLADQPAARAWARGAWQADDVYVIKLCYTETPYVLTLSFRFAQDRVTLTQRMNVGFGPTERPALSGRAERVL